MTHHAWLGVAAYGFGALMGFAERNPATADYVVVLAITVVAVAMWLLGEHRTSGDR